MQRKREGKVGKKVRTGRGNERHKQTIKIEIENKTKKKEKNTKQAK